MGAPGAMMMFILICARVLALAFRGPQGKRLLHDPFEVLPGGVAAGIGFLMLQTLGVAMVFTFPAPATWLPRAIGR